ncbi:hypothetical protein CBF34_09340 [Vagococcus penaei]|uniref:Uncharacterized protein n=1 Tax=Vagococcus penaei TaxID=633807 RepID=A0A1Q2D5Y3_9ENTE|nr:hypothetical protein BW732_05110 [Vagococcus penaei]RST99257.1 hypothetical protein CBF34_09340 [Vagococcus penaei]
MLPITLINAVIGIRPKTADAWVFFRYRLSGTIIGCLLGSVVLYIAGKTEHELLVNLLLLPFSRILRRFDLVEQNHLHQIKGRLLRC